MNNHISSDQLISHHRVRADYTPSPFDTLQFSYGFSRYTKFTFELNREPNTLKKKILTQLEQDFTQCQSIDLALSSSDMLSVLLSLLPNPDQEIRLTTVTILKKMCLSPLGRTTIITRNCISSYQALINDPVVVIRHQTYLGLINFIMYQEGIQCVLHNEHILIHLVDKLTQQPQSPILLLTLTVLNKLMEGAGATAKALKTPIIHRLTSLIANTDPKIVHHVCLTLSSMSFDTNGKKAIVGCIPNIYPCLKHSDEDVREASCLLLCSLAQLNEGKTAVLTIGQYAVFQALLNDNAHIALNTVQLIASLAQHPHGRTLFTQIVPTLEHTTHVDNNYIQETIDVIRWKP